MEQSESVRVIVCFSGGMDSLFVLWALKRQGYEPLAVIFGDAQGGSNNVEVERAIDICRQLDISYKEQSVVFPSVTEIATDDARRWRPGRNLLFLTYAAVIAIQENISIVAYGAQVTDEPYPDCTIDFIRIAQEAISEAIGQQIRLMAPALALTKTEMVEQMVTMRTADIEKWLDALKSTISCYQMTGYEAPYYADQPCGQCASCKLREEAFAKYGLLEEVESSAEEVEEQVLGTENEKDTNEQTEEQTGEPEA